MERGRSPFQGRYQTYNVDFSPIAEGGAAWGRAFESFGESIGEGIKKYGLDKKKRVVLTETLEGHVAAMKKHDSQGLVALGLDKDFDMGKIQDMSIAKLEGVLGKVSAYSATALKNMERRSIEINLERQEDAEIWKEDQRRKLSAVRQEMSDWSQKSIEQGSPLSQRDILSNLSVPKQALIANMELIDAGTFTPKSHEAALAQTYNIDVLTEKLARLPELQRHARRQTATQMKVEEAVTPEDKVELARRQYEGAIAQTGAIPLQVERQKRQDEAKLKGLEFATSDEMLKMDKNLQLKSIEAIDARINAMNSTVEMQKMAALAKANPAVYEKIKDNNDKISGVYNSITSWKNASGQEIHGSLKDYNKALVVAEKEGEPITPSAAMKQNKHMFDQLQREAASLNRGTDVDVRWPPQPESLPGMMPFEEWKEAGHMFGFKDESYKAYVDEMKSKGFQRDQISPPPSGEMDWR